MWETPDRDSELFRRYTDVFFSPVDPYAPELDKSPTAWFVQYPVLKPGTVFNFPKDFMAVLSPVDFYNLQTKMKDPFEELWRHQQQLAMAGAKEGDNYDTEFPASQQMMGIDLQNVLGRPRNAYSHPAARETVGGFIYQKMGRMGLLMAMQDFEHELPITKYVEERGEKMVSSL